MSTSLIKRSFIEIYDIEVLRNCFLYLGIDTKSNQIIEFVIFGARNDLREFCGHLRSLKGQIGFNNLNYDSQVCQFILNNELMWLELEYTADQITEEIFKFSQETINRENVFLKYSEYKLYCKQLDLYKMHHFDNRGKVQSLKGLQCNLNFKMCLESPIDFNSSINEDQLKLLVSYCKNDILSTKAFFEHDDTKKEIELRKGLAKSYDLPYNSINWSNSKIGSELILKFYCEATNKNPKEVRKERTERTHINLKDCIPKNVKFKTQEFNDLLRKFESIILYPDPTNKFTLKEKISVQYKGLSYEYGVGGIHSAKSGCFESTDEKVIYDIDVSSLYPSIAIANNLFPLHLGEEFIEVYKNKIVDVRLKEKAKGKNLANKAIVEGLKQAANSVYGKSNEPNSFLRDSFYTYSTTIIGQIQLSLLAETISEEIPNSESLQWNTDGGTILLYRNTVEQFKEICKNWEKLTKLTLEEVIYKKIYIRDVNSYCAIPYEGKVKLKGVFEKDKLLHKDPSSRIIAVALENYIVNDVPIEDTINNHKSIWDFLLRTKFKKNSWGEYRSFKLGKKIVKKAQKVERYFVSNDGDTLVKVYSSGKESLLQKGWKITEANNIESENAFDYNINRRYYIEKTYDVIDEVEKDRVQLSLFI